MKELVCKICGKERKKGRRLCSKCESKRKSAMPRYTWNKVCKACGNTYTAIRKYSALCLECSNESRKPTLDIVATNNYKMHSKSSDTEHRFIAKSLLGDALTSNCTAHHLDGNPTNNALTNLIVLSRADHGKLHAYLRIERVIIEKSLNENSENCWEAFIVPKTTAWLEMTGAKVIKLWELGNQQPSC